jgi:2-polyprenyl-3-methyl-5-hydroxy-6-metoxy-1,4-benzoquinol methylase
MAQIVRRGGPQLALYLQDADFVAANGSRIIVQKSDIPSATAGMQDVIVRHKARYGLVGLFCRPGKLVLDFPCGSGYASSLLSQYEVVYHGRDIDAPTIEYARMFYGSENATFAVDDLCAPQIDKRSYDIIGCIEGLEHIKREYQSQLIHALAAALRSDGTLVISSPEAIGRSGPSQTNSEHLWELTREDFELLLFDEFRKNNVEIVSQRGIVLSTGVSTNCLYGVCHK